MLYRTVISPSVFNIAESNSYQYSLVINLLKDLNNNCLLLEDENSILRNKIMHYLELWPVKFRKPAKELIKQLRDKNHRMVKVNLSYNVPEDCGHIFNQLASNFEINAALYSQKCCVDNNEKNKNIFISTEDYSISKFNNQIRKVSIRLSHQEWTQGTFENQVLVPIFKYAKHIKLYDRYIGRTISTNIRYTNTLNWILDIFIRESYYIKPEVKTTVNFEIYTGLLIGGRNGVPESEVNSYINRIRELEAQLGRKLKSANENGNIKIILKKENGDSSNSPQYPHARYLFTNQIGLFIDRGFDLLSNNFIRDLHISYQSEESKITQELRLLEDLL